eukprot:TRINITY_DN10621_c0_g2_i1.p2 TRINITY_DN10621_c0_g2~~TRINITY_DN10621_c0_g2_i1.p2  ORF type:complete len:111 (-),score=4.96 TRINITY_DN10621_c0_g2_i1:587-919(-)
MGHMPSCSNLFVLLHRYRSVCLFPYQPFVSSGFTVYPYCCVFLCNDYYYYFKAILSREGKAKMYFYICNSNMDTKERERGVLTEVDPSVSTWVRSHQCDSRNTFDNILKF